MEQLIEQIISSGAIIVIGCIVVGYIIKNWIPDTAMQNKYIPTINAILGGIAGIVIPAAFSGDDVVTMFIKGMVCGLLASLIYDKIIAAFTKKWGE